jgi:DNA polymerase
VQSSRRKNKILTPKVKTLDIKKQYYDILEDTLDYLKTGFTERDNRTYPDWDNQPSNHHEAQIHQGEQKSEKFKNLEREIRVCTRCRLYRDRLNAVPGKGNINADVIFIGEGPGEMEDIKGEPFVGKAGQLLTKMLAAIQLKREDVYITNIVKCRPPENRTPLPEEIFYCVPFLEKQISLISPRIICCLGGAASKSMLGTEASVSSLRGKMHQYKNIPLIPTYHPAAILRFPERYKRASWNDLKMLRDFLKNT